MNEKIKIAKQLVKIARMLIADDENLEKMLEDAILRLGAKSKIALMHSIREYTDAYKEEYFYTMDTFLNDVVETFQDDDYDELMGGINDEDEYVYESDLYGFQSCGEYEAEQAIDFVAGNVANDILNDERMLEAVENNIRWYPGLEDILEKLKNK